MSDGVGIKVVRGTRVALVDLPGALDALQPRGWVDLKCRERRGYGWERWWWRVEESLVTA